MSAIYPTRLLSGRVFRLLFIYPSADSNQQLDCHCLPFEIDAAPSYEALSYTWGAHNPSTDNHIRCNGEPTTIGFGLTGALKRLRLPKSTRIVWIDAICINQKDNEEKNCQVPLMGSIYSLARRVVVWLGPGDLQQINETVQCVRLVANACRQHDRDIKADPNSVERYKNLNLSTDIFTSTILAGLTQLYDRPWFSRIWCVQEICLARDAVVLWDEQEMPWSDVGLTASWIFDITVQNNNSNTVARLLSGVESEHADLMYDTEPRQAPLLELLRSHREWKSTNPRDMVYGLLSLVAPESEAEALQPDYAKTEGDVFADTVLVTIQLYSRLTALAYVSHPEEYDGEDGYRSWAPRWDRSEVAEALGVPEHLYAWKACARHNTEFSGPEIIKLGQLCLSGILYDTVAAVEEVMMDLHNLKNPEEYTDNGIHQFLFAYESNKSRQPSLEKSSKDYTEWWYAFARTLCAGSIDPSYVQSTDPQTQRILFKAFSDLMIALSHSGRHETHNSAVLDSTASKYQHDAYFYCNQRRFFWTENGTFGLGPQCMRTGDIVVVLYGGNTPYVLRPRGDAYLFIGQAYVDRIMQGQLVEEVQASRLQKQQFCLI